MKDFKRFIKPILLLVVVLLIISLVKDIDIDLMMTKIQNNIQEGLKVVKITEEKSQINDENLTIRFRVPTIHYKDEEVERIINSYIKENIKEYISVQRQKNNMKKYEEKHIINISYSVVFEDEHIINLIIEREISWGEKEYKLEKDSYVFSLKNGNRIYLDELLKGNDDYDIVIAKSIKDSMDTNHPLYNKLNIDKNTNYYIQDRYIYIYFNPYKQSQDDTQYEFKIPYDIFKNKIEAFNNFFFISVDKEVIKNDNKYLKSNIEIPIIKSQNESINNNVNDKIKKDIMSFYEKSLKEAEDYLDDLQIDNINFVADATFEVKKNTSDIISILVKYYKYSGGAHGYYEYIPYNINLNNGKFLVLEDLFKKDSQYKVIINKEIEKQIKELEKESNMSDMYDFNGIKDNQKFYLSDHNIVIYFDLYDIAPYVAGVPEFPIIIDNIKEEINEEYINLLT